LSRFSFCAVATLVGMGNSGDLDRKKKSPSSDCCTLDQPSAKKARNPCCPLDSLTGCPTTADRCRRITVSLRRLAEGAALPPV